MWPYIGLGGVRKCLLGVFLLAALTIYISFNQVLLQPDFNASLPLGFRDVRPARHGDICVDYLVTSPLYDLMYDYTIAFCLARARQASVLVGDDFPLLGVFLNLTSKVLPKSDFASRCNAAVAVPSRSWCGDIDALNVHTGADLRLTGKHHACNCFEDSDIRKEFLLNRVHDMRCGSYVNYVKTMMEVHAMTKVQFVCLHVDSYLSPKAKASLLRYLPKALNYFISKQYPGLGFLIHGYETDWIRDYIIPRRYLRNTSSVDLDMVFCVVSYCDHVIMTSDAFSWWAAYLSNGIVVYDKDSWHRKTDSIDIIYLTEYMPSYWIPV